MKRMPLPLTKITLTLKTIKLSVSQSFTLYQKEQEMVFHLPLNLMILTLNLILIGCSPIPTQEMSDARQALQAAREAQAQIYVPKQLAIAEQNLIQAEQHLAQTQFEQARLVAILTKKQALNTYQLAKTLARAQKVWQAVADLTASPSVGKKFLKPAQLAAQENNMAQTIALAETAYQQGRLALNQAQLKQANLLITKIKLRKKALAPEALTRLQLAEEASRQGDGQQAYNLVKSLLEPNQ
jgi:hypothetical protein